MKIENIIYGYNFVNECRKLTINRQTYYLVSFRANSKEEQEQQEKKINSQFPELNFIFIDFIPIDNTGKIDRKKVFSQSSLISLKHLYNKIKKIIGEDNALKLRRITELSFHIKDQLINNLDYFQTQQMTYLSKDHSSMNKFAHSVGKKTSWNNDDNLVKALFKTAKNHPEKGITLIDSSGKRTFSSYSQLLINAKKISYFLNSLVVNKENVFICIYGNNFTFELLWGCILSKIPAIIIYFNDISKKSQGFTKFVNTLKFLKTNLILTNNDKLKKLIKNNLGDNYQVYNYNETIEHNKKNEKRIAFPDTDSPVFYQLTSGSTGMPKCIIETHDNIISHIISSAVFNQNDNHDISLNWIPLDHVVPIITYHFRDVYFGSNQIHVDCDYIISQPSNWLKLIAEFKITLTWAPNFGYKLLLDSLSKKNNNLYDISSIRYFMNAGEQVTKTVAIEFERFLIQNKMPIHTMQPAFGMAEVATCMTYNNKFSCENIGKNNNIISLGQPIPNCEIRIVDNNRNILKEREIGHLEIKGTMLSSGYLNNKITNDAFYEDGWFHAGDVGYILNGELYITGRSKEMIIIRGNNYYCYDIEEVIEKISGVKTTYSAAISVYDSNSDEEKLIVFFVINSKTTIEYKKLCSKIREKINLEFGINPELIIPISKTNFPKTSSGKIQRSKLKEYFLKAKHSCFSSQFNETTNILESYWTKTSTYQLEKLDIELNSIIYNLFSCEIIPGYHSTNIFNKIIHKKNVIIFLNNQNQICPEKDLLTLNKFFISISEVQNSIENVILVCQNTIKICDHEINQNYRHAWLFGYLASIKKEIKMPNTVVIDNDKNSEHSVYQEIMLGLKESVVCYRENTRYIKKFRYTETNISNALQNRKRTFLLIGGTGGIGNEIIQYFQNMSNIELIVTGRNKEVKHESHNYKYIHFDTTEDDLEKAFNIYKDQITDIIYLPGNFIELSHQEYCNIEHSKHITSKMKGLEKIVYFFHKFNAKINIYVFTSIVSIIGSAKYGIYAASNSLTEAYVDYLIAKYDVNVNYISWSTWGNIGMSHNNKIAYNYSHPDFQVLQPPSALLILKNILSNKMKNYYIGMTNQFLLKNNLYNDDYYDYFELTVKDDIKASIVSELLDSNLKDLSDSDINVKILLGVSEGKLLIPESKEEKLLSDILKKSLKRKSLDKETSFFQLGGDSLAAIQTIIDIKQCFDIDNEISLLFAKDFFQQILDRIYLINQAKPEHFYSDEGKIRRDFINLSKGQLSILYECQIGKNKSYNIYKCFEIDPKCEKNQLKSFIGEFLARHDILSLFINRSLGDFQFEKIKIDINDIYLYKKTNCIKELREIKNNFILEEFDIYSKNPLFKFLAIRYKNKKLYFLFLIHHIICDEWSIKLFIEDFYQYMFYQKALKPLQHIDQIGILKNHTDSQNKNSLKYPEKYIKKIIKAKKIISYTHSINTNGMLIEKKIDEHVTQHLKKFSKEKNITLACLLQALFHYTLHFFYKVDSVNVIIPVTTRNNLSLANIFGFFTNTSIVNSNHNKNDNIKEFIDKFKSTYKLAIDYKTVPFSNVINQIRNKCHKSFTADIAFTYEDYTMKNIGNTNFIKEKILHNKTAKFPMNFIVKRIENDDDYHVFIEYQSNVIPTDELYDFLKNFFKFLNKESW
jgi:acyl-CoA synthetase (AMP-forming)/AMP-acid ligase II/acyl carrier protein/short-subunit dehydrogenase